VNAFSWPPISRAKLTLAVWNAPCTQRVSILIGGKARDFDRPTNGWVAGVTSETVRDTVQRVLLGRSDQHGTGTIPRDCVIDLVPSRGVPESFDIIRVRHVSGGVSTIGIKAYSDGRPKFQGETLDWVWLDEEPDASIYSECLTRINVGNGPVWPPDYYYP
jgi:hypothetical protein